MESYELTPEQIIAWSIQYAGYDELEEVAKALYALYVERRKRDRPEEQAKIKKIPYRGRK